MASSFEDAFESARKKKGAAEPTPAEVEPFDPHSVQSATPIDEQQRNLEMRKLLAEQGEISPDRVPDRDVDISRARVPQYSAESKTGQTMQREMDALTHELPESLPSALMGEPDLEDITRDRAKLAMERKGGVDFDVSKLEADEQRKIDLNIEAARAGTPKKKKETDLWGTYAMKPEMLDREFRDLYADEKEIPEDVLRWYEDLMARREKSLLPGATAEERTQVAAEMESFMTHERMAAEAREGSKMLPTMFRSLPKHPIQEAGGAAEQPEAETAASVEGTPKEWRDRLRGLVGKLTGGVKEKLNIGERTERLKGYATQRLEELNSEAAGVKAEKFIRTLGESYDKLSLVKKMGLGVGLGVGAAAFVGVSGLLSTLFLAGITTQRVAGMASMYIKIERGLQDIAEKNPERQKWYHDLLLGSSERQLKTRALLVAATCTLGVGALTGEAVKLASESSAGEAVHEWLKQHYPFSQAETPAQARAVGNIVPAEVPHPAAAGEVLASAVPPEISSVSVEASKGHGYEYMMKRLWEQMQERQVSLPPNANPESDIYKLLHADAKSIDSVVHRIAADPKHGFFNADGTSTRIDMGSHMTIGTDGQIHLDGAVHAAENAPQTPPYQPEASTPVGAPAEAPGTPEGQTHAVPADVEKPRPTQPIYVTEAPATDASESVAPVAEASATHATVTNQFGLEVASDKPHVYAGAEHTFVYGGSPAEQAHSIQTYLSRHPEGVVLGTDETGKQRVPWHLVAGKVVSGPPMRTEGFLGLFSTFMDPPGPEEFEKIIG